MGGRIHSVYQSEAPGHEQFHGTPPTRADPLLRGLNAAAQDNQGEAPDAAPEVADEDVNNPQPDNGPANGAEANIEAQAPGDVLANIEPGAGS
ncbi:hypothetical protein OPQ81_010575 [Rhizoctonia solani]|nr:hypothetical protein OPQ81_010575 [Rhizoctonia solani]